MHTIFRKFYLLTKYFSKCRREGGGGKIIRRISFGDFSDEIIH
jgi:hypothetical protein